MAYKFVNTSFQTLSADSLISLSTPLTMVAWFNGVSGLQQGIINLSNPFSATATFFRLALAGSPVGTKITTGIGSSGVTAFASSSIDHSSNTDTHVCAVFSSNILRNTYVNGILRGSSTVNVTSPSTTRITIGANVNTATPSVFNNGTISEVGIWNAAITSEEIISLAKGITPDKIRPQNLVFYAPLIRDLQDVKGGLSITNNNGATVTNHPRIYS